MVPKVTMGGGRRKLTHSWVSSACSGERPRSSGSSAASRACSGTTAAIDRPSPNSCAARGQCLHVKGQVRQHKLL